MQQQWQQERQQLEARLAAVEQTQGGGQVAVVGAVAQAWEPDAATLHCAATFEGHRDCVWSLAVGGSKLFSGSGDDIIRVWDTATHAHLATLEGHTDYVFSLAVGGSKLFSGSWDKTIRVLGD